MSSENWVEEKHKDFFALRYKVKEILFSGKSEFQKVEVLKTFGHGNMLLNDDLVMITERDEFVYHDMISHVPLFIHPNPKNVLVIGGGDGGTAREALRHKDVEKVTMVEIDSMVVEACKKHIPQTADCLRDPRLKLIIADAVKFVSETSEKFDVILVDSTDPIGPAQPLFGAEFYKDIYSCLSDNGIVVSQGESPFYETEMQGALLKIISDRFEVTTAYNYTNLTYPGGLWSFTYASKGLHPIKDFNEDRVKSSGLEFSYYNIDIHRAAFCLPEFMLKNLKGLIKGY